MNIWKRFKMWLDPPVVSHPPYRTVVKREHTEEGEIVTLECGHQFRLVAHRRASWPCGECESVPSEIVMAHKTGEGT
jgi:hypothetical protein